MNMNEYHGLIEKYGGTRDEWLKWRQMYAFEEFSCQMEEYEYNEKSENNDGRELMHITPEQVEKIMDLFLDWIGENDLYREIEVKVMRNAIQEVTGLIC